MPEGIEGPITLDARVNYRKFDRKYLDYIFGPSKGPELPVVVMATDKVELPISGGPDVTNPSSPIKDAWQRWNDYGIGLLLEGATKGAQKGELKQAEVAFKQVAELGKADGWVNLARVYQREGRIPDAREALAKAASHKQPGAPWVIAWLTGQINSSNGYLDEAIENYRSVLDTRIDARKFDFSLDYEVLNALAGTLFNRARIEKKGSPELERYLKESIATYRRSIAIDTENVAAHYGLGLAYEKLEGIEQSRTKPVAKFEELPGPVTAETILAQVAQIERNSKNASSVGVGERTDAYWLLRAAITTFLKSSRPADGSRLGPLHEVVDRISPLLDTEISPFVREAFCAALAKTHKALHNMLKPDEVAEGRAVSIARKNNPAADLNAQSIVIHPLHRPGDPARSAGPVATREPKP